MSDQEGADDGLTDIRSQIEQWTNEKQYSKVCKLAKNCPNPLHRQILTRLGNMWVESEQMAPWTEMLCNALSCNQNMSLLEQVC